VGVWGWGGGGGVVVPRWEGYDCPGGGWVGWMGGGGVLVVVVVVVVGGGWDRQGTPTCNFTEVYDWLGAML
jgi:hypothetical protein